MAVEQDAPDALLSLYRRLIAWRRAESVLEIGSYQPLPATGDVLASMREAAGMRFLGAHNLGDQPARLELPDLAGRVVVGKHAAREGASIDGEIDLRGDEAVVVRLGTPHQEPEAGPAVTWRRASSESNLRTQEPVHSSMPRNIVSSGKGMSPSNGEMTSSCPDARCTACNASRSSASTSTVRLAGSTIQYSRTPPLA